MCGKKGKLGVCEESKEHVAGAPPTTGGVILLRESSGVLVPQASRGAPTAGDRAGD